MKTIQIVVLLAVFAIVGVGATYATQHEPSVERGKALFNDPGLGTNGKTCSACHPNGKGLEKATMNKELENTINACIVNPLKGTALDKKSSEMQSLMLYIKSIGK